MISVQMSDDIRKYKVKTIGPFTTREAAFVVIAGLLVFMPIMIFVPGKWDTKMVFAFLFSIPVALCGFKDIDGTHLEVLALRYIYSHFLAPRMRKYKLKNTYKEAYMKRNKIVEQKKLEKMTKSERKEYMNKKVKYSVQNKVFC